MLKQKKNIFKKFAEQAAFYMAAQKKGRKTLYT